MSQLPLQPASHAHVAMFYISQLCTCSSCDEVIRAGLGLK